MEIDIEADDRVIEAEHLRLVWMSPSFMLSSLEGRTEKAEEEIGGRLPEDWPDGETARLLRLRLQQMTDVPDSAPWLLRALIHSSERSVVGYVNFHGSPRDGKAELGYTVFQSFRRRGYATEAARAIMRWAHERYGIDTFIVSISPANEASLGLARKLGFIRVGRQMDEIDGVEWVFELEWPRAGGGKWLTQR